MKNNHFCSVLLLLLLSIYSCSNKIDIKKYSEKLGINFPSDMRLVFYEEKNEFQDYTIYSIYKLSFNQKNTLEDEIISNICVKDDKSTKDACWQKCSKLYTYEYKNESEGIIIRVAFIADNNVRNVIIKEVKL